METTIVITKAEYLALRDAFDILGGVLDQVEDESGWAYDLDADDDDE